MSKIKVFIDGSAGTTGLRIHDRLSERRDIELIQLADDKRKNLEYRKDAIERADAAFLCLPDAASREICEAVAGVDTKILDTSTAHRTNPDWSYGFPELSPLFAKKVVESTRIAVPGCHASGFCSIVAPLVSHGIISPDYPLVCTSITGYSGGGKKMIEEYRAVNRPAEFDAPRQYATSQQHKHLPEMKAVCGLDFEPCFSPIVSDFYSGMTVSVPLTARLLKKQASVGEIREMFAEHYKGQKLISVAADADFGMLASNTLSGRDSMKIFVGGNDERILIASTFDNLGKGASGAAIQCFNLAVGAEETEGLVL